MIKIPKYTGDSHFQDYKDAVSRCKGDKKKTLTALENDMERIYSEYDERFIHSDVHNQLRHKLQDKTAIYLRSLYLSGNSITELFRKDYNTRLKNRIYAYRCPYCTYNETNTLEHILPKDLYPEYAVHALNLIPCCSQCNSYKGISIKDDSGMPSTLNFYYHDPNAIQFLEAEFELDGDNRPTFLYNVSFPVGSDPYLSAIILNHYTRLHLTDRLRKRAESRYAEEEVKLILEYKGKPVSKLIEVIASYVNTYTPKYGKNHYYIAMLRCMANSEAYRNYLERILQGEL